MLIKNFIFIFFFIVTSINAQTSNWIWAKREGGTAGDAGLSITTDAFGNVIAVGDFGSATMIFGSDTLNNSIINGTGDLFIIKYDAIGNPLWGKSAGGNIDDIAESVTTDPFGNIYVVGHFNSSYIIFGSDTLFNAGYPYDDIFVAKYDANGNPLWARSAGGSTYDKAFSVTLDSSGNVIMTGWFGSVSIIFGADTLFNAGSADIFVVKYDSNGNAIWAKRAGSTSDDGAVCVTTDVSDNILVAGYYHSMYIIFDTDTLNNTGGADMFIVKYDSNGNALWAKTAEGLDWDIAFSVATDTLNNVYLAGNYYSSSLILSADTLSNSGGYDLFLLKYDSDGNLLWAKSAGGNLSDDTPSIDIDAMGNIIMAGSFKSPTIVFGPNILSNMATGDYDFFVAKYDVNGNALWGESVGGNNLDELFSIDVDASGNIVVTGRFGSPALIFGTDTLSTTGGSDIFVAKLSSTTGIDELTWLYDINIYPNPSNGKFKIENFERNTQLVDVYNSIGDKVFSTAFTNKQTSNEIDVSSQPDGVYFVLLNAGVIKTASKIIIQK